ncbi:MAG: tetratricopeptide repeat protein [Armatimonadota bacterium]
MSSVQELNEHYSKGIEYFDQGLYREAISEFETLTVICEQLDPMGKLARFYLGESYAQLGLDRAGRGATERAEQSLRRAVEINPQYPDLHYHLACILMQKNDSTQAVTELEKAVSLNPRYSRALLELGLIHYRTGDREAGMELINRAVQNEPGYSCQLYREAVDLHRKKQWDRSLAKLEDLRATNVDDITYHFKLGKEHYMRGDYKAAAVDLERALSIQPSYADIRNWLGVVYLADEEPSKALVEFSRALEINPNFTAARLNAASAFIRLGCTEEAANSYRRVLEIDPDNAEAREGLADIDPRRAA